MKFAINDKIVYPMHGAGVIEKIEKVEILKEMKDYYVLRLPGGDMKVMIPLENCENIGIRPIISRAECETVLGILAEVSTKMQDNWNRRYRENIAKLKTGDIISVAEVLRNLTRVDRDKKLSTGEKKLLTTARQILVSELVLAMDKDFDEVSKMVADAILGDQETDSQTIQG